MAHPAAALRRTDHHDHVRHQEPGALGVVHVPAASGQAATVDACHFSDWRPASGQAWLQEDARHPQGGPGAGTPRPRSSPGRRAAVRRNGTSALPGGPQSAVETAGGSIHGETQHGRVMWAGLGSVASSRTLTAAPDVVRRRHLEVGIPPWLVGFEGLNRAVGEFGNQAAAASICPNRCHTCGGARARRQQQRSARNGRGLPVANWP